MGSGDRGFVLGLLPLEVEPTVTGPRSKSGAPMKLLDDDAHVVLIDHVTGDEISDRIAGSAWAWPDQGKFHIMFTPAELDQRFRATLVAARASAYADAVLFMDGHAWYHIPGFRGALRKGDNYIIDWQASVNRLMA